MAYQIGLDRYLGIGREGTHGTPVKSQALCSLIGGGLASSAGAIESRSLSVADRMVKDILPGRILWNGSYDIEVQPEGGFLIALLALLGSHADTGPTDEAYTHVFKTSGTPDPVTFAEIAQQETPFASIFRGGYVTGMNFASDANSDDILTASLQCVGQEEWVYDETTGDTDWANIAASFALSTSPLFTGLHLGVSLDGGSNLNTDVTGGNFGISSAVRPLVTCDRSRVAANHRFGRQAVTGTVNLMFSTMAELAEYFGLASVSYTLQPGTVLGEYDLEYDWLSGDLIGSGDTYYQFTLGVTNAKVLARSAPVAGDDAIIQSISWKAIYNDTDESDVIATMVNSEAATYLDSTGTAISVY